jgi:soluble lytic murein transglycosylase-like protein
MRFFRNCSSTWPDRWPGLQLACAALLVLLLSPATWAQRHAQATSPLREPIPQSWLDDMSQRLRQRIPDESQRLHILHLVYTEAQRHNLMPELVLAVIDVESRFDPLALSSKGAMGLMQVMPFWAAELGAMVGDLFDIPTNIRFGCAILRQYLERERGDLLPALQRYNGSLGQPTYPALIVAAFRNRWVPRYRPQTASNTNPALQPAPG